jgi:hypothetical protein
LDLEGTVIQDADEGAVFAAENVAVAVDGPRLFVEVPDDCLGRFGKLHLEVDARLERRREAHVGVIGLLQQHNLPLGRSS